MSARYGRNPREVEGLEERVKVLALFVGRELTLVPVARFQGPES